MVEIQAKKTRAAQDNRWIMNTTNPKHTPGPCRCGEVVGYVNGKPMTFSSCSSCIEGDKKAARKQKRQEQKAWRDLLDAAPDLLAACEAMLMRFEAQECAEPCDHTDCAVIKETRAAIAKARGET